jgi:hypothetical protein
VIEGFGDRHEGLTDLLLADRIQTRFYDERCIIGIEFHEAVKVLCRDRAIGGFNDLLQRVRCHNHCHVLYGR